MSPFRLEMSSSVDISAPLNHVWQVFSELDRWTEWCGVCLSASGEDNFGWKTGQGISLRLRLAGVGIPFNVTVTESRPQELVAWASTKLTVTAVRTFSFVESELGTLVTDHKLFRSKLLPLALFYPRPVIRRMTESMLTDLKAECEAIART